MKAIIQKVLRSSVSVDNQVVGSIDKGYNVLLGIAADDTTADADWVISKLLKIRLWNKEDASSSLADRTSLRWSDDIQQVNGSILVVSQFTLHGQLKGNKVDFHRAMKAVEAEAVYGDILARLRTALSAERVQAGIFGAMMQVTIVNDGREWHHTPQEIMRLGGSSTVSMHVHKLISLPSGHD